MTALKAKDVFASLKGLGLTPGQARKLLPAWWSPEIEKQPDGVAQLCVLLSRRLSLDLDSLRGGVILSKAGASNVAYKHRVDATEDSLRAATQLAFSLSRAVLASMSSPYTAFGPVDHLIAEIRRTTNDRIGLAPLVNICWRHGVPVIPLPNVPVGMRKMDGAVVQVDGRPAIILSKKRSSRAWMSFILAHEIGHVGLGHLSANGSIVDVSLQEQSTYQVESADDLQERQADEYALALLGGGGAEVETRTWPTTLSSPEIAVRSRKAAQALGVEAGHMALRYAFQTRRWPEAVGALNFLSEDSNAEAVIKSALQTNVDFDRISDDLQDLVVQLTGVDGT